MKSSSITKPVDINIAINKIIQSLELREVIIFCGAGISRNSGIPIVNQFVPYLLRKLGLAEKEINLILDQYNNPKIPFESFLQNVQRSSDVDNIFNIYELGEPNSNHLLIANLIKFGIIKTVVTTNFDRLIEKALLIEPKPMIENKDFEVIHKGSDFEGINWSIERVRIIKIHGSVEDKESMAITLKQVASQVLSKPRKTIINKIFSDGNHKSVLILGYSSSDLFDISPQIQAINKNYKKVYYIQHSDLYRVEDIQNQIEKNPFSKFNDSLRLYYDTSRLTESLWKALFPLNNPYELKFNQTNWKKNVDAWYNKAISEYSDSIRFRIPGDIFMQIGEIKTANKYYKKALQIAINENNEHQQNIFLGNIGITYFKLGKYKFGIEYSKKALKIAQKTGDKLNIGKWQCHLGNANLNKGEYDNAIKYYKLALKTAEDIGDNEGKGTRLGNIGIAYKNKGEYNKALKYYLLALNISKNIGNKQGEGSILTNIGNIFRNKGDYNKALEYFIQALKIVKEIGGKQGEGICFGNIGNTYLNKGEYAKALENYRLALKIAKKIGDKQMIGRWLNNIGITYLNLGDNNKTIKYCKLAFSISKEIGDLQVNGKSLSNIGSAYLNLNENDKAIKCFGLALNISKKIDDKKEVGNNLGNLGIAKLNSSIYLTAIEYFEQALKIAIKIGDKLNEGMWLGNLGKAFNGLDDTTKAIKYLELALCKINPLLCANHPFKMSVEDNLRIAKLKVRKPN